MCEIISEILKFNPEERNKIGLNPIKLINTINDSKNNIISFKEENLTSKFIDFLMKDDDNWI